MFSAPLFGRGQASLQWNGVQARAGRPFEALPLLCPTGQGGRAALKEVAIRGRRYTRNEAVRDVSVPTRFAITV